MTGLRTLPSFAYSPDLGASTLLSSLLETGFPDILDAWSEVSVFANRRGPSTQPRGPQSYENPAK
jgi:hypothetical protein